MGMPLPNAEYIPYSFPPLPHTASAPRGSLWLFLARRGAYVSLFPRPEKRPPSPDFLREKKVLSAAGKFTAPVRPPKIATIL